jgi:hypothetical protein
MTDYIRLRISTAALDDHQSRLYGHDDSTDTVKVHQDIVGATYTIVKRTPSITVVDMSIKAITEFLDDADYQYEFTIDSDCKHTVSIAKAFDRAIFSVRKQMLKAGA